MDAYPSKTWLQLHGSWGLRDNPTTPHPKHTAGPVGNQESETGLPKVKVNTNILHFLPEPVLLFKISWFPTANDKTLREMSHVQ